jgi:hypothetical protein
MPCHGRDESRALLGARLPKKVKVFQDRKCGENCEKTWGRLDIGDSELPLWRSRVVGNIPMLRWWRISLNTAVGTTYHLIEAPPIVT